MSEHNTYNMSKRFMVTLADRIYKELEDWAEFEGRPVASLAAYLLENAVREQKPNTNETKSKF